MSTSGELARAFDEGFTACAQEHMKQGRDPSHPITRENPYAETFVDWMDQPQCCNHCFASVPARYLQFHYAWHSKHGDH